MKNKRDVLVTGIGIVNPLGIGASEFWSSLINKKNGISTISKFNTEKSPVKVAGEVPKFNLEDYIPKRQLVRTDLFIQYALIAAHLAIEDSLIDLENENRERIGIFFGNNAGGWDLCQRGFYELYTLGTEFVNPWQATAWFPAAAQGFLSIKYDILGHSKSFVCDRASGASAMYFALQAISLGKLDVAILGGTEAPITPFSTICYYETGQLSGSHDTNTAYSPFSETSSGIVLGEGSTVLILESREHAEARNARMRGVFKGAGMLKDSTPNEFEFYERNMNKVAKKAGISLDMIDLVIPEGCGVAQQDSGEINSLSKLREKQSLKVSSPKSSYGHLYGASCVTEVAYGILCMENNCIPASLNMGESKYKNIHYCNENIKCPIASFMVNSRSRDSVNGSFILSKT